LANLTNNKMKKLNRISINSIFFQQLEDISSSLSHDWCVQFLIKILLFGFIICVLNVVLEIIVLTFQSKFICPTIKLCRMKTKEIDIAIHNYLQIWRCQYLSRYAAFTSWNYFNKEDWEGFYFIVVVIIDFVAR